MRIYRRLVAVAVGVLAVTGAVATTSTAEAATAPTPISANQFTVSTS